MFSINQLSKSYLANNLFSDLNFHMQKKMRVGFVGRNGSGKSTLFRILMGKEEADSGQISVPKNYELGWLQQQIVFTEDSILKEAIKGTNLPEERLYEAEKILCGLGFSKEDLDKHPSSFSGGYHLRLNLSKVLIQDPDCLLLDEPTNYLDIVSIRFLERFLQRWPKEVVIISHDQSFIDKVCTHIVGLHRKTLHVSKGTCQEFYEKICEQESVHEKTRQKIEKKKEHIVSFAERFGAKASKAKQAQSKLKSLDKMDSLQKLADEENLTFSFKEAPFYGMLMLKAKNLTFSYDKPLIEDFSLEVEKGEKIAIIGKNARGKSTLLRLLIKDLEPKMGDVIYKKNLEIGYFGQTHIDRLDQDVTIEEEIALENPSLSPTEVRSICGVMLFSQELAKKKIKQLSGGERSRVLLAKIIAKQTNLLILDEPTHHLDMESIEALIESVSVPSHSLIMVTHDENILKKVPFTRIVFCRDDGQTHFIGNYEEFLDKIGFEEEQKPQKKKGEKSSYKKSKNSSQLEKQISKTESEIAKNEENQKDYEQKLIKASEAQDLPEIEKLNTLYEKQKLTLEKLYEELLELYTELES